MQIAIIGAGNVGGALGAGWAKAGHRKLAPDGAERPLQGSANWPSVG
jgi:pyrroline-5-carboxylate reductase